MSPVMTQPHPPAGGVVPTDSDEYVDAEGKRHRVYRAVADDSLWMCIDDGLFRSWHRLSSFTKEDTHG